MRTSDGVPCVNEPTEYICTAKCFLRETKVRCGCYLFFLRYLLTDDQLADSTPFCNSRHYRECLKPSIKKETASGSEYSRIYDYCSHERCSNLCTNTRYLWTV